jgi:hypothetical protein
LVSVVAAAVDNVLDLNLFFNTTNNLHFNVKFNFNKVPRGGLAGDTLELAVSGGRVAKVVLPKTFNKKPIQGGMHISVRYHHCCWCEEELLAVLKNNHAHSPFFYYSQVTLFFLSFF